MAGVTLWWKLQQPKPIMFGLIGPYYLVSDVKSGGGVSRWGIDDLFTLHIRTRYVKIFVVSHHFAIWAEFLSYQNFDIRVSHLHIVVI